MKGGGGARPGAGRKPKGKKSAPQKLEATPSAEGAMSGVGLPTRDPLEFLLDVMQGTIEASAAQVRAAVAAAQYKHMKKGDGGKKDEATEKAKKAGQGKFAAAAAPLALVRR